MIKLNSAFLPLLQALKQQREERFSPRLEAVCSAGFVAHGDAWILKHFSEYETNFSQNDFADLTGYECVMNKIHIEDFAEQDLFWQSFEFVRRVFRLWTEQFAPQVLNAILSVNDGGIVVKFHKLRENERLLFDDFEQFEEGLLQIDSRSDRFFHLWDV
jgi:hypothetical protein